VAFVILTLLIVPSVSRAEEPFAEFAEGLRKVGYLDTALEYLNGLSTRKDLPPEFAKTLDLERGMTYRAIASASRVPEDREQALTQAEAALKKFTSANADHPRAPFANSELGQLLFERARTLLWDSESPSNADRKKELQQQARTLIEQAKAIYQLAHDQYKKQYDGYPKFIDRAQDEDAFQERLSAEVKYLRAWFNLTRCTYERGQTFDKGTKERDETLIRASEEFEAIHTARRSNPIGLQSRLMMGKCFQEQDDINRALGIYNEMLSHKSTEDIVQLLKSIALQYRLICLNHEKKNDFQLVLQEADAWLKDKVNRRRLYTEIGLGILWEKSIAGENLGKDRTVEEKERSTYLKQALSDAKNVARFPGPYREPAVSMVRRLNSELGEKDEEPKDFDTAFERARGLLSQQKGLKEDLAAAKSGADKQKARQAINLQLAEIGRMLEMALTLREEETDPKAVAQARYLLSYVFMSQRKSFDAIILARYCMTKDKLNDPDSALNASEIAINAAVQAFNDAGADQTFELNLLQEICNLIITQYPQSTKGNEARFRLGQVYRDLDQPLEAAKTYLTVPEDYSEYSSAQIQAGQSYWLQWVKTMAEASKGDAEAPAESHQAELDSWKSEATRLLQNGIKLTRAKLGKDAQPTPEIVAAEVSLATILNIDGKYPETIQHLTGGAENSVVNAMNVPEGQERPTSGIQSAAFAGQAYRLLLRAYVGTQQIPQALQTMANLESTGGQDTTAVYTQLGRELQEELKQKKAAGNEEEVQKTRQSFEKFLEKVYEARDVKDYNSLLWIGETYFNLGQGLSDDAVAAADYYEKANKAYQEILSGNLADGTSVLAIKLRVVRCLRAQAKYDEAVTLAQGILNENPMSIDVQFEAAYTLSDWGADATAGQPDKLLKSMEGMENAQGDKNVWGWARLTTRLLARQGTPEWETLKDRFYEARYAYSNARRLYGKSGAPGADEHLGSGVAEIMMVAQAFHEMDDVWFAKFDKLYQDMQVDQGKSPTPLERPEVIEIPPEEIKPAVVEETTPDTTTEAETEPVAPTEGPNPLLITLSLALAAGGAFAAFKLLNKPEKRKRNFGPEKASFTPPPGGGSGGIPAAGGDSGVPDFSAFGAVEAPKVGPGIGASQRKKKVASSAGKRPATPEEAAARLAARKKAARAAAAAQGKPGAAPTASVNTPGQPVKKKRILTPEEAARYRAAKAAKAKAAAAQSGQPPAQPGAAPKAVRREAPGAPQNPAAAKAAGRKLVKKRPPQPPPSE